MTASEHFPSKYQSAVLFSTRFLRITIVLIVALPSCNAVVGSAKKKICHGLSRPSSLPSLPPSVPPKQPVLLSIDYTSLRRFFRERARESKGGGKGSESEPSESHILPGQECTQHRENDQYTPSQCQNVKQTGTGR